MRPVLIVLFLPLRFIFAMVGGCKDFGRGFRTEWRFFHTRPDERCRIQMQEIDARLKALEQASGYESTPPAEWAP